MTCTNTFPSPPSTGSVVWQALVICDRTAARRAALALLLVVAAVITTGGADTTTLEGGGEGVDSTMGADSTAGGVSTGVGVGSGWIVCSAAAGGGVGVTSGIEAAAAVGVATGSTIGASMLSLVRLMAINDARRGEVDGEAEIR